MKFDFIVSFGWYYIILLDSSVSFVFVNVNKWVILLFLILLENCLTKLLCLIIWKR